MILSLRNLKIGYKESLLDESVNLDVKAGNFIALAGKNGIGKSTLLKTISGIINPVQGEILSDNNPVYAKDNSKLISIVLNEIPLASLQVNEVLRMGRIPYINFLHRLRNKDKLIIEQTVYNLKLQYLLKKRIGEISDGERQIVMIAKALIQDTPIILLDEPTSHLDMENKALIVNILRNISKKGKLIIFTTHDINMIIPIINELWIMKKEGVRVCKTKAEIKSNIQDIFESEYLNFDEENMFFKIN